MELIEEFLDQYNKQYDFYAELARIGSRKLETEINSRGLKAIVSYRAKTPDRLRDKLQKRKDEKKYKKIQDIFEDIFDLAGIRIALYFPSDRGIVDENVEDLFDIKKRKDFPESSHNPKYTKRFSGYWATHYRVTLRSTNKEHKRYHNTLFEIQVASVLMHAWAEVEHDLVYKPLSGGLSDEELALLDQINGLVLAGEIALEQLQKAMTKRTRDSKEIADKYELTNFIVNSLGKNYIVKLKLGNTALLSKYFDSIHNYRFNTEVFSKFLNNVNQSEKEPISDQLLYMLLSDYLKDDIRDKSLKNYFAKVSGPNKDTSGFELFIKTWIVLEKAVTTINSESNVVHRKYFVPNFDSLAERSTLTKREAEELQRFRRVRNQLLHGIETPANEYLNKAYIRLSELTKKVIAHVGDEKRRKALAAELEELEEQLKNT